MFSGYRDECDCEGDGWGPRVHGSWCYFGRGNPGYEEEEEKPTEPGDDEWRTQDGTVMKIKDMEDRHLINAINYFYRRAKEVKQRGGTVVGNFRKGVLLEEAFLRGLLEFK